MAVKGTDEQTISCVYTILIVDLELQNLLFSGEASRGWRLLAWRACTACKADTAVPSTSVSALGLFQGGDCGGIGASLDFGGADDCTGAVFKGVAKTTTIEANAFQNSWGKPLAGLEGVKLRWSPPFSGNDEGLVGGGVSHECRNHHGVNAVACGGRTFPWWLATDGAIGNGRAPAFRVALDGDGHIGLTSKGSSGMHEARCLKLIGSFGLEVVVAKALKRQHDSLENLDVALAVCRRSFAVEAVEERVEIGESTLIDAHVGKGCSIPLIVLVGEVE